MNFPTWLPDSVAEYTAQSLLTPNSEDCEIALKTLTKDERMRGAWETLQIHAKSERDLINYLWNVCNVLSYWNGMDEYGFLITPKEQKERISNILSTMDTLQAQLRENHYIIPEYEPDVWNPLDLEIDKIKKRLQRYTFFWESLPTKIGAKTAKHNFFMREMKKRVLNTFDKPLYRVIADTTAILFNSEDITEDNVRKA